MFRPYHFHTLERLEALFAAHADKRQTLEALEFESSLRTTKKAAEFRDRVRRQLQKLTRTEGSQAPLPSTLAGAAAPPAGWQPKWRPQAAAPAPTEPAPAVCAPPAAEPVASMALQEAERILGIGGDARWAQVESARFRQVALSSPELMRRLPEAEAAQRLAAARAANAAYLTLARARSLMF